MEEDKDIKVLEEFRKGFDNLISYRQKQAIENLIARNKELEEDNEELKADNKYLDERVQFLEARRKDIINKFQNEITDTTIPKSKVIEKIKELEKFIESKRILPVDIIEDQNRNVKWKIEVLQELLEGDK